MKFFSNLLDKLFGSYSEEPVPKTTPWVDPLEQARNEVFQKVCEAIESDSIKITNDCSVATRMYVLDGHSLSGKKITIWHGTRTLDFERMSMDLTGSQLRHIQSLLRDFRVRWIRSQIGE
jgi:hypothetical protein